jgi:hypothetical protein
MKNSHLVLGRILEAFGLEENFARIVAGLILRARDQGPDTTKIVALCFSRLVPGPCGETTYYTAFNPEEVQDGRL